jgi:hypothetical protein
LPLFIIIILYFQTSIQPETQINLAAMTVQGAQENMTSTQRIDTQYDKNITAENIFSYSENDTSDLDAFNRSVILVWNSTTTAVGETENGSSTGRPDVTSLASTMIFQNNRIEKMAEFFIAYISIATVVIGLFGNFLTIYVFLKQKKWGKYPLHFLFVLAFADSGVLIFYGLFEWIGIGLEIATEGTFYFDIKNANSAACKISVYLFVASACLSAWMVVLVTFERLLAVSLPLKASSIMSVERRKKFAIIIPILIFLLDTPELYIFDTKPIYRDSARRSCLVDWELPLGTQIFALALIFVTNNIIPSVLVMIMNIVIISKIVCLKGKRGNLGVNKRRIVKVEVAMASKLLIISTVFVVTMGTHTTFWTIYYTQLYGIGPENVGVSQNTIFTMAKFSTRIALINFSFNFIIYCFTYDFYLKTVRRLFCCCFFRSCPNSPEGSTGHNPNTLEKMSNGSMRMR